MRIKIVLLLLLASTCHSQVKTKSPQEIIDEVNAGIDQVSCGISSISNSVVNQLNTQIVEDINRKIKKILEQFNLSCLEGMLNSGFLGLFNIDFDLPNFCELVQDQIGRNREFFEKTENGRSFEEFINTNVEAKNLLKDKIKRKW